MIQIRHCNTADLPGICAIYNHYVTNTVVTFEEKAIPIAELARRVAVCTSRYPWLVSTSNGTVVGYAYARVWHERTAYRHSVETSIYVAPGEQRKGHGTALYQRLIEALAGHNCHAVLAGIALPNEGSVALHEKTGFTKVAHFHEVGKKFGNWVDVGYWQRILD